MVTIYSYYWKSFDFTATGKFFWDWFCAVFYWDVHYDDKKTMANFRSSHQRCSVKKVFLEVSQNSQENTCARVSFFNKAAAWKHLCQSLFFDKVANFIKKRDSGTGVFMWILWNFWEHLFHRTPPDDGFLNFKRDKQNLNLK